MLKTNKKILSIDYGDKSIGLALYDIETDFFMPYKTIYRVKKNILRKSLREIVHHRGGVGILFMVDNKFIFEKQYRYALNEEIIEMPAGKLEEGEIPLEAAKRELLEETGYRPLEMIHLGDSYPTPGYSTEVIHLYYCPKAVKEE